jgi:hypothetical protein
MTKENFTNFATTTLVTSSLTTTSTSFVVSTGQGALFPSTNFAITMDTEIMFITSRSTDTFTVGTRGFDGSTAATHSAGATIQLCSVAYNYNHLWQNVSDTFLPDVAPINVGNTPSSYDHEFEVGGNALWQLYPASGLPSGSTFSLGTPLKSNLLLHRGPSDSVLYTAYVPFTQAAPWVATCKLSHSLGLSGPGGANTAEVHFFVSDQTNPTASADTGNRIRIDSILLPSQTGSYLGQSVLSANAHIVRMLKDVSGTGTQISSFVPISLGVPLYLRISCATGGIYTAFVGDGITYWYLAGFTTTFSVQSLGFNFYVSASTFPQTVAIDWVRVVTGTFPQYYGS